VVVSDGKLSYVDRLRVAWEIIWPSTLIETAWAVLFYGLLEADYQTLEAVHLVLSFFLILPFIVRRMIRKPYPGFRLQVLRNEQDANIGYQESLKVMWLLSWRTLALMLLSLLPVSFVLSKLLDRQIKDLFAFASGSPFANAMGLTIFDAIGNAVFLPLVIPGMLKKRYKGFRIEARPAKPEVVTIPQPAPRRRRM
jgi:hypothetical protein